MDKESRAQRIAGSASIGRFAPSPTGDLHFGSLVAAVASFLQVKSSGGQWLIRVEDIDPPREVPGSAERILRDLASFGLKSDSIVIYQSQRTDAYQSALQKLLNQGLAFHCGCSRADIPASGIYPGTCRNGLPAGKQPRSVRLKVMDTVIRYKDQVQGPVTEDLAATVGDFVIWRADGLPAYQLAVVVDDRYQQISEVVRGSDLLGSTARQIHLQNCLGLPVPQYAHHPVAVDGEGLKLSKRRGSDPITTLPKIETLRMALEFLGQSMAAASSLEELWRRAVAGWRMSRVPRVRQAVLKSGSRRREQGSAGNGGGATMP
jgi:glutamyl-Q tRNA(Asp) synthetase